MNLLLEASTNNVSTWILLGVLVLFLIVSPFLMRAKNKKEMEKAQQMIDSIKKGDQVMTAAGVIGKVISIDNKLDMKVITIETGDEKHKGYMTMDINAIYANLSNSIVPQEKPVQNEKVEQKKDAEKVEEKVEETKQSEVLEEQPKQEESVEEKSQPKKVPVKKSKTSSKSKKK